MGKNKRNQQNELYLWFVEEPPTKIVFPDGKTVKFYFDDIELVNNNNNNRQGWVYFLGGYNNWYKIGVTKRNPIQIRINEIAPYLPFEPILNFCFLTDDIYRDEKSLHARFDAYRINGEWFEFSRETIDELREILIND